MSERFEAVYLIETAWPLEEAAASMAGEQSSGTFVPVPGETPELRARSGARVELIEELGELAAPSLSGASRPGGSVIRQARVILSWPVTNIGPSLPNLIATVAGNLFELSAFSGLRLQDVRLSDSFARAYPGPRFGVEGTRRLSGVKEGPLIGTIIKPSVGLSTDGTAEMVDQLVHAGIDFIKDDELQSDGPNCPFDDRARAVMARINDYAERTGKKVMFAFNLTGEIDEMRRRHDLVRDLGGTCVMISLNSVGMSGFLGLSRHCELPIHAHRNGWGALSRHPALGWSFPAWAKLWRMAGADHMHVNGLANKFCEPDESVVASARDCLTPIFAGKPCIAMPVFSSRQTARQAPDTFAALGSADLIHAAGGGIMAHPEGPAAGVTAFREAWDAAMTGESLAERAWQSPELARALGGVSK